MQVIIWKIPYQFPQFLPNPLSLQRIRACGNQVWHESYQAWRAHTSIDRCHGVKKPFPGNDEKIKQMILTIVTC